MSHIDLIREFESMPFMYTPLKQPDNEGGIPNSLPFSVGVDTRTGRLLQLPRPEVSKALHIAYELGSMISGQMDEEGIGRGYTDAFISYVQSALQVESLEGKRILEIGCGTGYLLYRFKEAGAEVIGLEPGEHGQEKYIERGVPIHKEFFPTPTVSGQFDAIVIYGVLEHMEEPADFMEQLSDYLTESGKVLIAVPDCEPYLKAGDISMFIHEHWSYFTKTSLSNTLANAGFSDYSVTKAAFGGFLYAAVGKAQSDEPLKLQGVDQEVSTARDFIKNSDYANSLLAQFISKVHGQGQSLGIYVPGRAVNAMVTEHCPLSHCRFFDDNTLLHGTYFPGIDISVESRQALVDKPVDQVLIMSHSFGQQIADQLKPLVPADTKLTGIKELLT